MSRRDAGYMLIAKVARTWQKGTDLGVGAVVVSPDERQLSIGYSGLPRGIPDNAQWLAQKDDFGIHAELNAIMNAGRSLDGWTIYTTSYPCAHCAACIVQAGIARVVTMLRLGSGRWVESQAKAEKLLREAGVKVTLWGEV